MAFPASIDLSTLNGFTGFKLNGAALGDVSGCSVASAGDFNGDGFDDVIVGALNAYLGGYNPGAAYVVFGKASGFAADINLSSLDGGSGFRLVGEAAEHLAGCSVGSAGDINGDGFSDLIIGAPPADHSGPEAGASYVVFGTASSVVASIDLASLDGTTGFRLTGTKAFEDVGFSVGSAGDVNGDGFSDLVVGAFLSNANGQYSGATYVIFGKATAFDAKMDLSAVDGISGFKLSGAEIADRSGYSVASAGDVNGDGFSDLIVGADRANHNVSDSGTSNTSGRIS